MSIAEKIGLRTRPQKAWALYDWANSAFVTVIIAAIFPAYYRVVSNASDAADSSIATGRLAITTSIALTLVALMAPILGAIADAAPVKKKFLAAFMLLGASATAAMGFLGPDQWRLASLLFALGNIGAMGSFIFYDSLLPHIASDDELDKVSTAGYALGYVSGGVVLIAAIACIDHPAWLGLENKEQATRATFVGVALWWVLWSIPLFRRVPEPPIRQNTDRSPGSIVRGAFSSVRQTFRELRRYKQASLFLLAFLIYNDGIGTIIKFAVIYGGEIGVDTGDMIKAILLVQFVGIPCTFLFGHFAVRFSAKKSIYFGLVVYTGVSVLGYFMTSSLHFYLLAILIGLVQGGVQALSRSLFATLIPKHKSSEFFSLFAIFEKFAGIFGPLLFAIVLSLAGSSRPAILAIIGFFALGAFLLSRVQVEEGQRQARENCNE